MSEVADRDERTGQGAVYAVREWFDNVELKFLIMIALVFLGVWLFAVVSEEFVVEGQHVVDEQILLALREPNDLSDPVGPEWFEEMIRDFTAFGGGGVLLFITFAGVGYFMLKRNYSMAALLLITIVGSFLLSSALKGYFDRPRPQLVPTMAYYSQASFPSGHSLSAAATYITLAALLARLQPGRQRRLWIVGVGVILAALVGFSRIYLGVHWPTDVLGGLVIGSVWALIVLLGASLWRRRLLRNKEPEA